MDRTTNKSPFFRGKGGWRRVQRRDHVYSRRLAPIMPCYPGWHSH